jgi:hypothetical protein
VKQADLGDVFKKTSRSVCMSAVVISPDSLCYTPLTSSAVKTPDNIKQDPDDPESADKGDGILLGLDVQPKYRSRNNKLPVRT